MPEIKKQHFIWCCTTDIILFACIKLLFLRYTTIDMRHNTHEQKSWRSWVMPVNIVIIYNRAANGSDKYLPSSRCNIHFINIFVCINCRRQNITCLVAGIYYNIPCKNTTHCALSSAVAWHYIQPFVFIESNHFYMLNFTLSYIVVAICVQIKNKYLCAHKLSFIFPILYN